jgi:hypothetical protein
MIAADLPQVPRSWFDHQMILRGVVSILLLCVLSAFPLRADDAEIAKLLKEKGVAVTESKGNVTAVTVPDGAKLTDVDFKQITQFELWEPKKV